ncbi:MAG: tetratricopeptide repeat protein [Pseudomonadota bacterium]
MQKYSGIFGSRTAVFLALLATGCAGSTASAPQSVNIHGAETDEDTRGRVDRLSAYCERFSNSGELVLAQGMCTRAHELDPTNPLPLMMLADTFIRAEKLEAAAEAYKILLNSHPDNAEVHYRLGKTYMDLGQDAKAMNAFNHALLNDPMDPRNHNAIAVLLDQKGNHTLAQDHYRAALELDSSNISYKNNLGLSLALTGQRDAAIAMLNEVTADPNARNVSHNNLAMAIEALPPSEDLAANQGDGQDSMATPVDQSEAMPWTENDAVSQDWDNEQEDVAEATWTSEPAAAQTVQNGNDEWGGDVLAAGVGGSTGAPADDRQEPLSVAELEDAQDKPTAVSVAKADMPAAPLNVAAASSNSSSSGSQDETASKPSNSEANIAKAAQAPAESMAQADAAMASSLSAKDQIAKGLDAYRNGDFEAAYVNWIPLAQQGNRRAQFYVGGLYYDGRGVAKDEAQAVEWLNKSASAGYFRAQELLASLNLPQDAEIAVAADDSAPQAVPSETVAVQNNDGQQTPTASSEVASVADTASAQEVATNGADLTASPNTSAPARSTASELERGLEAYRSGNYEQAHAIWHPLAVAGNPRAQFYLGGLHIDGHGVEKDYAQASDWLTKSDRGGYKYAKQLLAQIDGHVMVDEAIAAEAEKMEAPADTQTVDAQQSTKAQMAAAPKEPQSGESQVLTNDVARAKTAPDTEQAQTKAAQPATAETASSETQVSDAQPAMIPESEAQAPEKVAQSAPEASPQASGDGVSPIAEQLQTGLDAYRAGEYASAYKSWLPLAESGVRRAQFYLGGLYLDGHGVPKDLVQAYYWLKRSDEAGYPLSNALLSETENLMSADQKAMVQASNQ